MIATGAMSKSQHKTFPCHVRLTVCYLQYVPFSVLRATSIVAVLEALDCSTPSSRLQTVDTILVSLIKAHSYSINRLQGQVQVREGFRT